MSIPKKSLTELVDQVMEDRELAISAGLVAGSIGVLRPDWDCLVTMDEPTGYTAVTVVLGRGEPARLIFGPRQADLHLYGSSDTPEYRCSYDYHQPQTLSNVLDALDAEAAS